MTRKDYVLIADAIKSNIKYKPLKNPRSKSYIPLLDMNGLINDLCDVFKCDNERFDADRFKEYISG